MASAVRSAGPVPPMGYRYPSRYRRDTRVNAHSRALAIAAALQPCPTVQPRQSWAIALERRVRFGWAAAKAGALAGTFMALYTVPALVLTTDRNVLAPLYLAAVPLAGPDAYEASRVSALHADAGSLLAGLIVTAVVGAAWGVLFGALVRNERPRAGRLLPRGMLFGLAVLAWMNPVVLPCLGLPSLVQLEGWTVATFAHLLFGFLLGCWPLVRSKDFQRRPRLKVVSRR